MQDRGLLGSTEKYYELEQIKQDNEVHLSQPSGQV